MSAEHHELEEMVAAYVLGATDFDETEAVRRHLEECSSCRALAQRLSASAAAVPMGLEGVAPPPGLRDRVLASARGLPQTTPMRPLPRGHPRRPIARPPLRLAGWNRPAVALAAIVAFALGGGLGLGVGRAAFGAPAAQRPGVAQYSLAGTGAMAGAAGRVFDLRAERITLVQFSGLPALGPGRIYELWLIDARGHAGRGAVFAPDPDGTKVLLLGRSLDGLTTLAVTDEAGPDGSPAPTSQPQLLGKLS
jgi:anti-sigma-K factor RskA